MLFSAYPSIFPAASWPPAGRTGGCSNERGSIQKHKKRRGRPDVCFVSLLQRHSASAHREITSYRFKYYTAENG